MIENRENMYTIEFCGEYISKRQIFKPTSLKRGRRHLLFHMEI